MHPMLSQNKFHHYLFPFFSFMLKLHVGICSYFFGLDLQCLHIYGIGKFNIITLGMVDPRSCFYRHWLKVQNNLLQLFILCVGDLFRQPNFPVLWASTLEFSPAEGKQTQPWFIFLSFLIMVQQFVAITFSTEAMTQFEALIQFLYMGESLFIP